jgi:hypothetical protein
MHTVHQLLTLRVTELESNAAKLAVWRARGLGSGKTRSEGICLALYAEHGEEQ